MTSPLRKRIFLRIGRLVGWRCERVYLLDKGAQSPFHSPDGGCKNPKEKFRYLGGLRSHVKRPLGAKGANLVRNGWGAQ